jgi:Xaa-Pro aminopeptidase
VLNTGRNTVTWCGEGDMTFQRGDLVRNDYVSYYFGYPGHQSRTVVLGEPTREQRQTYRNMREVYLASIEQCRVGAVAKDIVAFAENGFQRHGYHGMSWYVGHSVGPWMHQQAPYILATSNERLEAGMVIAMEPHVGNWHLQDLILITDDQPKLLSDRFSTEEMFVVA